MNHDVDMIGGVVERRSGQSVGGVVEVPEGGRGSRPDQPIERGGVVAVAEFAARRGEVVLIPPTAFGIGRQRLAIGGQVDDDVAADRDESANPLRPQRGDDVGGTAAQS